ncbi:putative benzoate 4-monooxygenase cytochrome P450 [Xylaria arbuscula]|nr:putative benzoate 4-monooxygenase cytochrome P450 [Xylaria arbuscula]
MKALETTFMDAWRSHQEIAIFVSLLGLWSAYMIAKTLITAHTHLQQFDGLGPIARIGPNHLVTNDPNVFRIILGAHSRYQRGPWFDSLRIDPNRSNLITDRDRAHHEMLRSKLASGYGGKDVEDFEHTIDENLMNWVLYIQANAMSNQQATLEFDIARSIQWLLYDMICRLCFGVPGGFVDEHKDQHDFQETLEERLPIVEQFAVLTEANSWVRMIDRIPVLRRILPSSKDKEGLGVILRLAENAIAERQDSQHKPYKYGILDSWLRTDVDRNILPSEIAIALFAGSDTTATSIRALLLHVISNPLVYLRLRDEVFEAQRRGAISDPVRELELPHLPYLQACIKEGLRIFPPITALRERVVPPEGDTIGSFIPGGTNIGLNLPGLLTHSTFGLDATVFRPERWLDATPDQLRKMERIHELVFNWGFTRCLGIRMAYLVIGKFFVEVLRRWDITTTRPQEPWRSRCHGIFYQKDFFVRITERCCDIQH